MAVSTGRNCCCVPKCSNSSTKQPYLNFHSFPTEEESKKWWIHAIRRDEGKSFAVLSGSTYVCSQHFAESDYTSSTGRKRLKRGVIPSKFKWNTWGNVHQKRPKHEKMKVDRLISAMNSLQSVRDPLHWWNTTTQRPLLLVFWMLQQRE
ncbi:hypothetical protein QQF64_018486 [Cirrhinus molitorella]|uniref:THAP domain-containing protein 1 n=1 Tax=Cirrhinus molitorella TaxID=172907 RepID=A0ABR3LEA7_9TELE